MSSLSHCALLAGLAGLPVLAADPQPLVCRGVEESGRYLIGQPGFGPHLISLFVTGGNPWSACQTIPEHLAWVNDPLHSYLADGTGGLVIWAHPGAKDGPGLLAAPGLAGLEVHYTGDGFSRDALWDQVLTGCLAADRPFLWAFAADDTHSKTNINLSWYAALLPEVDELALKHALRTGAFYASNGPRLATVAVAGSTIRLTLPAPADVLWLRAGQSLPAAPGTCEVSPEPGPGRCVQLDRQITSATLDLAKLAVPRAELGFVRAVLRGEGAQVALTQPWRVRAATIDNPYPATGTWVRGQTHNHTDTGPGAKSSLPAFRQAYLEQGQIASFSTDYSYWESPYQWLPSDGTPQLASVTPSRLPAGAAGELTLSGLNFQTGATVQLGGHPLAVTGGDATTLRVTVPADVPAGEYDLVVTNPDRRRDCLPLGVTLQEPNPRGRWRTFTVADGLPANRSTAAACFGEEVWIGTLQGVARFRDGQWTIFGKQGELAGGSAYAMTAGPAGGVWISGNSGLAFCGPDGQWSKYTIGHTEGLNRGSPERWGRIGFDREGTLWAANRWGAGLGRGRPGAWERLLTTAGIPSNSQSAVACTADGTLWIGFGNGLHRLVDGRWQRVEIPAPLTDCRYAAALSPAPDGALWAAMTRDSQPDEGGLVRLDSAGVKAYTRADGLPSARVRDVLVTRAGVVWAATDRGLARLGADGRFETWTPVNSGLGHSVVLALAEDPRGALWCATAGGVSCLEPSPAPGRAAGAPGP